MAYKFRIIIKYTFFITIIFLLFPLFSYAEDMGKTVYDVGMTGTVGDSPIVMIMTLENKTDPIAAHYSYVAQKIVIPLEIKITNQKIILSEPSGGVFDLHFKPPNGKNTLPLSFYTSIGLEGRWYNRAKSLPVSIQFEITRDHLKDCIFYPDPKKVGRPDFFDSGCEHTPDKAVIDKCLSEAYTSNKIVNTCMDMSLRTCRFDQRNMNVCISNINYYFDGIIEKHTDSNKETSLTAQSYQNWIKKVSENCRETSSFGPEGSGFSFDIEFCVSAEKLRFIQNNFQQIDMPLRSHRLLH